MEDIKQYHENVQGRSRFGPIYEIQAVFNYKDCSLGFGENQLYFNIPVEEMNGRRPGLSFLDPRVRGV